MLIVGDREAQGGLVAVRNRKHGDQGAVNADEFIARLTHLIAQKSLEE
jgi:threonyl-tRNA synthetase